jgi:hypothetical protein
MTKRAWNALPLLIVLALQAALLFRSLNLLPVWTDESITASIVTRPLHEIIPVMQKEDHPPLYFLLLHGWPWHSVAGRRAFSCIWALLATLLVDVFWTRWWPARARWLALAFFAFSPCLLLYARMARSYSMQTALFLLAAAMFERWLRAPRSVASAAGAFGATLALVYTHYLPGAAALAAFAVVGLRGLGVARTGLFVAAIAAAYAPWALALRDALGRWGTQTMFAATYSITGNLALEHAVKLGFAFVSLTIGESFLGVSLLVAPVVGLLAIRGVRTAEFPVRLLGFLAIAGCLGYIGVSRWVSYAFTPARLIWLLPFLNMAAALGVSSIERPVLRRALAAAILLSYTTSIALYFRRENFLNLGYVAPLPEIAATLNRDAQPGDLILVDPYNTDFLALAPSLSGQTPVIRLERQGLAEARKRIPLAGTVWIVRNTRDASPGRTTTAIQSEACAGRPERDTLLDPYAPWQRVVLRMAGMPLTHFYEVSVCGVAAR